jgi:Cytochrome C oxidase, cbb3-type, subunit III/Cytochrome c
MRRCAASPDRRDAGTIAYGRAQRSMKGSPMKKVLKWAGATLGTLVIAVGLWLAYVALSPIPSYPVPATSFPVDVTPERIANGKRHTELLCAGCHLDPETGALTGRRMPDLPTQFGESWSRNITKHPVNGIGSWTDGEIAYLLRTGVNRAGRYTPPWMVKLPNLSDEDLRDVIAFLRSDDPLVEARDVDNHESRASLLTKVLCRVAWVPFPYPSQPVVAPPPSDKVAWGRYLLTSRYLCFGCHSADFKTNDELYPEKSKGYLGGGNAMPDASGKIVYTANITTDPETGIGGWTQEQFHRAVVDGIRPDKRALRYPMAPLRALTGEEVSAMFAYLQTVPSLRNKVPSPEPYAVPPGDRGRQVYYTYGCNSCHGDTGRGRFDLVKGVANHPTDEELVAYIKHPERTKPGIEMPTWDGVIGEDEYAPLATYVRSLAARGPGPR